MDKEHPSFIFEDLQLQMSVPAKFEHLPLLKENGPADIVFKGGDIYTMDEKNPQVEALAVKGERILAVGSYAEIEPKIKPGYTKIVFLDGKALFPGFIEAHQHATLLAANRFLYIDISGYSRDCQLRTKDQVLEIISTTVSNADPDEWCMFLGWDIALIRDLPQLSADIIDELFSKKIPIMIIAQNGHSAWVNHKTFEVCGITEDTPNPPGGIYVKDENGNLTGQLLEEPAIMSVISKSPKSPGMFFEAIKAIHDQWKDYASRGFTTVTELAYRPELIQDLWLSLTAGLLDCPIRLALYMNGVSTNKPSIIESSKLWVAGIKFWADGSPLAGTAAINEPYLRNELTERLSFPPPPIDCGHLNWPEDELKEKVKFFHDQGKQISLHANGERAVQQSLDIFQELIEPGDDRRPRLEHVGLITEEQLQKCGEIGVTISFLVHHLYFYGNTFAEYIVERERTNRWAPLAAAIKYLGKISIHQDQPSHPGPPLPFASMKTAITRTQGVGDHDDTVYGKEYCITIEEAIKAYTTGPAYQLFKEKEIGSLEVGKFADLVILSTNPYKVDPMKLDTDVQVVETYTGGRCNHIHKN